MKFTGTLEGYIPHHINPPLYQQQPCNYRLKIRVTEDVDDLLTELGETYDNACKWWKEKKTGKSGGYWPAPFTTNEDGSVTVTVTANPNYEEFPFPVVDGDLVPLHKDVILKEGTLAIIQIKSKVMSPKSLKGGVRLVPQGMQILKAVSLKGSDSGEEEFSIDTAFKKQKGFKQSKPAVQEPATVPDEDDDF
jgi:hypothetical protein